MFKKVIKESWNISKNPNMCKRKEVGQIEKEKKGKKERKKEREKERKKLLCILFKASRRTLHIRNAIFYFYHFFLHLKETGG